VVLRYTQTYSYVVNVGRHLKNAILFSLNKNTIFFQGKKKLISNQLMTTHEQVGPTKKLLEFSKMIQTP
jgi:hypothetical protein